MVQAVMEFDEQLDRIGEIAIVVLIGGMFAFNYLSFETLGFVVLLFTIIRPISVWLALLGSSTTKLQRRLMAWFAVYGVGSLYYLVFTIHHGLDSELQDRFIALTLTKVATLIVVHGVSVTPLMNFYNNEIKARRRRKQKATTAET